jgi:hypothetical protein
MSAFGSKADSKRSPRTLPLVTQANISEMGLGEMDLNVRLGSFASFQTGGEHIGFTTESGVTTKSGVKANWV